MDSNNDYTKSGNSNYLYGHGGSNPYGAPYGSPYGAGNNQYYGGGGNYYAGNNGQYNNNNNSNDDSDENESSFDPMEWVMAILHYWYLILIGLVIAMGVAMFKNRKWIPTYYSQGTIIIKEGGYGYSGANSTLMQGFGVDAGYKNVNNQVIMLSSYDLMCRVVDSLPFMRTEYITQGRFKTRSLYRQTPILVETTRIDPRAYGVLFQVAFDKDGSLKVTSASEDAPLSIVTHYGEKIETDLFDGTIWPTELMTNSGKIYFRFRSKESLVDEFMGSLQLSFVNEGSTVLSIGLTSETPERDCDFIDKLAQIYLLQNLEQKNEVADNSIRFINEQLTNLQDALQVSESAMTDFRQENKFVDVSSYAGQLMTRISDYDQQNMALRLRETYFDYLTNYLKTNIENGAVIAPTSLGLNEPMLMSLVQQLNDLRIQRGELSEKNVYYAKYTKDIENVKQAINEVVSSMRASLEIEKKDLKDRYSGVEKEIQNLPEKELQMVAIERNYRIDDNYYTFFLQKRAEAEIQKASNTPDNTILDKARTTSVTNAKEKRKTTTTCLIVGLIVPLVIIILSELLNNKFRSPKDIQKLKLFKMIGAVRHASSLNPTLVKDNPRSSYAEMLRSIRTHIEFILRRKENMVIMVTSTESGDGKTFLSTNMAALYAMTGKKTLLIDMDLRKPNIHTKLALDNGYGLSNYLIGDCAIEDAIIRDTPFGFDLLRAGTIPPNPGELIHSDALVNLLNQFREQYTYIVIDTSPIGLVPDAYAIIEQSDICLYVIRCMQTNKGFCKQTLQQMTEVVDNPDKVQLVLSDIPSEGRHAYGYGSSYGYGYGTYGYGKYGYGKNKSGLRYRYGQLYGRLTHQEERNSYNYYSDDDEPVDTNKKS